MTPLVLNKHCCGNPPDAVYIGRPSPWGNPFTIGRDGTRAEVIAKHEAWLRGQAGLLRSLDELRDKHLICFCAPAACHGDLLLRLANTTQDERVAWWRNVPFETFTGRNHACESDRVSAAGRLALTAAQELPHGR